MTANITKLIRRSIVGSAVAVGALALYALSFGPVLLACGAKANSGWGGLPSAVRVIYTPLTSLPASWLTGLLDAYVQLWVAKDH